MNENNQPMTRDGVLLKVGDKVFTHTRQAERDCEIVYIDGGSVVFRDSIGSLNTLSAWLCWGRDEAMLQIEREITERKLQGAKEEAAAIPAHEAKLVELDAAIAALQK